MSLDYMTLAWRTELQAGPRLVLLAICDNANDEGNCYPSIQGLSNKCGLSVRAVRGHVSSMDASGLLVRHERMGRSSYYQISLKALRTAVFKSLSARKDLSEYDKGVLRSCAPVADTPADSAPRQILPTPPADSAAHPSPFLPTPPADSAAITNIEPTDNQQGKKKDSADAPVVIKADSVDRPDEVSQAVWADFLAQRKDKRAKLTNTALAGIKREADKAGWTLDAVLTECCTRGWVSFKAEWVVGKPAAMTPNRNTNKHAAAARAIWGDQNHTGDFIDVA